MSAFLKHAEELFAAAHAGGTDDCDLSILVNRDGGIHMIADADWQLEALRAHHGANAVYRVHRSGGNVRLEARSANQSCVLAADRPARALAPSIPDFPQYLMIQ